jgi:hypothetical protein
MLESRVVDLSYGAPGPATEPSDSGPPIGKPERPVHTGERLWLIAALALSLLLGLRAMAPGLAPGVMQDDARQHLFWMARFRDPQSFPHDPIADYYQALAPPGYSALYRVLSLLVDPLQASKLLPHLLGLIASLCTFLLVRRLYPAPAAAFLAAGLMSAYVWRQDDLSSATSRAFVLPLLGAQLWALAAGRLRLAVGLIGLGALFNPVSGALGLTLLGLRLVRLDGWRPTLAREPSAWLTFLAAGLLVGAAMLPTYAASVRFGPTVSATQAREMPEFGPNGRNAFFVDDPYGYWLVGHRSGLNLHSTDSLTGVPLLLEYLPLAAALPALILLRRRLPAAAQLSRRSVILVQLLVASFALFFLAHALLFRLYLPTRYVKWSLPLVLSVAGGLALGILIETIATRSSRRLLGPALALALGLCLAAYPASYGAHFPRDRHPAITAYLRDQPKDVLVAGAPLDVDSVPAFAGRPVVVSRDHALAFHLGYYDELRTRARDLIEAYYAESPADVADFAAVYGVDLFLVNEAAYRPTMIAQVWSIRRATPAWEPFTSAVAQKLQGSRRFALRDLVDRCAVMREGPTAVVPAACVRDQARAISRV